ncbi:hypothetical protein B7463_g3405, partial [Scytalidium lignicola]
MASVSPNPVVAPPHVHALLDRLHQESLTQEAALGSYLSSSTDFDTLMRDKFIALDQDKCQFVYQIARAIGARNIAEIGTSFGVSTIYLALAVGSNLEKLSGSGIVIGTEYEKSKAERARQYWKEAGDELVTRHIDLREGDLRETLKENIPTLDLVLLDIWAPVALPALKLLEPRMRPGAVVIIDNSISSAERYAELLTHLRSPGFSKISITLRSISSSTTQHGKPCLKPNMKENEDSAVEEGTSVSEAPDGGYGWVVVAAVFLNNAHHWGIASSYGIFLSYYLSTTTFHGATPLEFAFIGGLVVSQALMIGPLASTITRLYGVRTTLLCGTLVETAALIGASFVNETWQLFLSLGICFGWGAGLQYISTVGIIPQWFSKRRGLASGIAAAGSGTGGLIYSLASNALIQSIGIAWTYRVIAIVAFVVNILCAYLFRDRNKHVGAKPAAINMLLFKRLPYWLFLGWGFLSIIGFEMVLFSLDDYARNIGLSAHQGSVITAMINLGQALGRPAIGLISDKLGRLNVATVPVAAEIVDLPDLPAGLTMMWLICAIPATFSEVMALELRQKVNDKFDYINTQIFAGAVFLGASVCLLGTRTWKSVELERSLPALSDEGVIQTDGDESSDPRQVRKTERHNMSLISIIQLMLKWKKM